MATNRAERRHPEHVPPVYLLGIPEVAARLAVDEKTVKRMIAAGTLFSVKLGRRRLVPSDTVDDLIAGLVAQARTV